jgi:hypothetical protein
MAPAQVQTTLGNWYTVQLRRRCRLKRGHLRNGGRDGRRSQGKGDKYEGLGNWDCQICTSTATQERYTELCPHQ